MAGGMASNGQSSQGQAGQGPQQAVQEFTKVAQDIQLLAKKYPEFVESAAQILPLIEKGLTKIAANPQRTPDRQAPPVA
jgi:hypothetical protein